MKKPLLTKLRMFAFILTVGTTIPLFIKYLTGQESDNVLVVDLHVWFGLTFIILAIVSMMKERK